MVPLEWKPLAISLATALITSGELRDPGWRRAFEEIPRNIFVPRILDPTGNTELDVETVIHAGTPGWLDLVYSDDALLTQAITAGEGIGRQELPSSSSSRPDLGQRR
ncbi:MAG: hypothetical protein ACRDUV_16190 [Pseudonocardiaceae bacterium]